MGDASCSRARTSTAQMCSLGTSHSSENFHQVKSVLLMLKNHKLRVLADFAESLAKYATEACSLQVLGLSH